MRLRLGRNVNSNWLIALLTYICSTSAFQSSSFLADSSSGNSQHAAGQDANNPFDSFTGGDADKQKNNRVIIGVLSQPSDPAGPGESYIAASYVKFLEASGARVVPFVHDLPKHEIKRL